MIYFLGFSHNSVSTPKVSFGWRKAMCKPSAPLRGVLSISRMPFSSNSVSLSKDLLWHKLYDVHLLLFFNKFSNRSFRVCAFQQFNLCFTYLKKAVLTFDLYFFYGVTGKTKNVFIKGNSRFQGFNGYAYMLNVFDHNI